MWSWISKVSQGKSNPNFPYQIGEKIGATEGTSPWILHEGTKQNGVDKVSIFTCDFDKVGTDQSNVAKIDYKKLKTMRHPNVVKFIDGMETDSSIFLVTEYVTPLEEVMKRDSDRSEYEISWGFHQILKIVAFLNIDHKVVHNNISITSVFVDACGDWKLGGFGFAYNIGENSSVTPAKVFPMLSKYKHNNEDSGKMESWSNDMWAIGCLIWESFNGPLSDPCSLSVTGKIPKSLVSYYRKMISPKAHLRPSPKQVIEHFRAKKGFMNNSYVETNLFLEELQLKESEEKVAFFKSLNDSLDNFPEKFCKQKLLPQLINAFEFGGAGSVVLRPLIKIGRHLSDEEYQAKVMPCILKLFSSPDRGTRISLLQQMNFFVKYLDPKIVDTQIFPQITTGFSDTVPALREETIKSMVLLVPKLSESTITKHLLKHLAILQQDDQASIRTNTTICIGKIACHFSEGVRKKVLATAFLRALQDPFPPARIAGILGLSATKACYPSREIAERILPALCSKTLDVDKSVRDQLFPVVRQFIAVMEKISDETTNESTEKDKNLATEADRGLAAAAADTASTWAGWAVNSLTSKIIKTGEENQSDKLKDVNDGSDIKDSGKKDEQTENEMNELDQDTNTESNVNSGGWDDLDDWDQRVKENRTEDNYDAWDVDDWNKQDTTAEHAVNQQFTEMAVSSSSFSVKNMKQDQISDWNTDDWGDGGLSSMDNQTNTKSSEGWDDKWEPFEEEKQSLSSNTSSSQHSTKNTSQVTNEDKDLAEKKREEKRLRQQALKEKRAAAGKKSRPIKLGAVKKSS